MNEIKLFENKEMGLQVRIRVNDDDSISMNAEDTAIGFGWCREKGEKQYVMWDRFNGFCKDLGFPHKCGKEDYIPESLYYLLGMKAGNDKALKYQKWLAIDVLPTLRKTGKYEIPKEKREPKEAPLSSVNMAVKTITTTLKDAGVDSLFIAQTVKDVYKEKAGIDINVPLITDTPRLYDKTEIAKELGIFSKSGAPHSQAVGRIIRSLTISDEDIVRTTYSKNGHDGVTEQYKPNVVEQVREWIEGQEYPNTIQFSDKAFTVRYH